ncbi:hypothetical protein [Novipirellula artificiosorum]|uniref:Glycosyltransferase RgtA/B/C/D-like domain-containing protein n=1 Tax=Novipirellula artificiosorum TaxID=2528016 RepID=A0A5C6DUV0_9BACT|nr:hypothetical protein [Novipirellula artificiosorum]TWU40470.1 hypothetical protein Poly41_13030 [Novipirellula artificiosorum]
MDTLDSRIHHWRASDRRLTLLCSVVIAVVLLFTYLPLFFAQYGFGDDFVLFTSRGNLERAFLADGRTVFALAQYLVHRNIQSIAQLGGIRLLTGIGVAIVAVCFYRLLRPLRFGHLERTAIAIALGTLPCMQTYVAQAMTWLSPYAALCSIAAATLTRDAFRGSATTRWPNRMRLLAAAALMLLCSATYQPMLAWYWSVVFLLLLDRRFTVSAMYRRRMTKVILLGCGYFLLCYLAFKLAFLVIDVPIKARSELTRAPLYKLYWFLRIQLPQAMNFWRLMEVPNRITSLAIAGLAILVVLGGYVLACRRLCERPGFIQRMAAKTIVVWTALLLCVFLWTHLHWLVIEGVPQSYRIIAPLGGTSLLLLVWSIRQWTLLIPCRERRITLCRGIFVSLAMLGAFSASLYNHKYWIGPHENAYRFLLHTVRTEVTPATQQIHIIRQGQHDGLVPHSYIECFGRPAFERSWAIADLVKSALSDSGIPHSVDRITSSAGDEPIPQQSNVLVIDTRQIVTYRM